MTYYMTIQRDGAWIYKIAYIYEQIKRGNGWARISKEKDLRHAISLHFIFIFPAHDLF